MSGTTTNKGKTIPHFESDEDLERFVETADLSEYDLSVFKPMKFELRKKDARINMRVPQRLLSAIKTAAIEEEVPYQRLMRDLIERGLSARAQAKPAQKRKKAS
jgi:predicted DNA binding CopG/RHH family protein